MSTSGSDHQIARKKKKKKKNAMAIANERRANHKQEMTLKKYTSVALGSKATPSILYYHVSNL